MTITDASDPFLATVIKHVRDYDASRPRSLQKAVGWSEVGGCRAYLGFRLEDAWESDETDSWGAQRGTAIHKYLERVLRDIPGFRTEVDTVYRNIPGHADLVHIDDESVTDWKTTKLVNSQLWASSPDAMWEKRVQAQGYAAGLIDSGKLLPGAKVRIVVIPVDGTFGDWWSWTEDFDRSIADWGAARLAEVRGMQAAGEPLPKDKPYAFCETWCRFFSLCRSQDSPQASEDITDPEIAAAIARYGDLTAQITAGEKEKKALAGMIRGVRGVAGEWRVSLTREGESKRVLDEDAVYADYAERGQLPPETTEPGSSAKLSVRKVKQATA